MTILFGILAVHGTFDNFIHEMDEISKYDAQKRPKKVNWKETEVFDNSNRGLGTYLGRGN